MKKFVIAVIACAALFSCSFGGVSGSLIPADTYTSVSDSGGYSYRTVVTLEEGRLRYEHFEADVSTQWFEAEFAALTDLGLNTYETALTKLASNQSGVALVTGVAQLKLTYNSPVLTVSIDGNGSGSFTDSSVDISDRSFTK
ncbi:MAG: hypothetical protein KKA67_04645 [Spirochaetes bacterium]|nr:hypothetical protein [Spirochaetota bacterium]MBU1079347.1 hypothetical protein [Spirochaetota bacterium]